MVLLSAGHLRFGSVEGCDVRIASRYWVMSVADKMAPGRIDSVSKDFNAVVLANRDGKIPRAEYYQPSTTGFGGLPSPASCRNKGRANRSLPINSVVVTMKPTIRGAASADNLLRILRVDNDAACWG